MSLPCGARGPPVTQGHAQSPQVYPHGHTLALWTTALPAPWEGSPSLTSCSCLLWLWAARVHVRQELGQAPHTRTKYGTTAHGVVGQLCTPQVLAQQPSQRADALRVCKVTLT